MSVEQAYEPVWTARRWLLCGVLILVVQFGCVFWFGRYQSPRVQPVRSRTPIALLDSSAATLTSPLRPGTMDPTLFALPTRESFSGEAWLNTPQFEYQPTNYLSPPQWLALVQEDLGDDFAEFVQTNLVSEDLIAERLPPRLQEVAVSSPIFAAGTVLRLEGGLAGARLQQLTTLPQAAEPVLTNTIVRLSVDSTGRTLSAALLSSCGTPRLDQGALDFAKSTRFIAGNERTGGTATELLFGTVVFQWWRADWTKLEGAPGAKPPLP